MDPRPALPPRRDGLKLMLLAKPNGDVERPRDLGARGLLKTTYRSVKFGS